MQYKARNDSVDTQLFSALFPVPATEIPPPPERETRREKVRNTIEYST